MEKALSNEASTGSKYSSSGGFKLLLHTAMAVTTDS
jgi:hypothetical protein